MKVITVNIDKCTGCRACELACSLKNTGTFNPSRARINVIGHEGLFSLPITCFQCEKPYCADVCPSDAINREESTGTVKIDAEKCTGCKMCVIACPFGNIVFSPEEKIVVKCELCGGAPECVAFCTAGALEFKQADTAAIHKKTSLHKKLKGIYTGTHAPEFKETEVGSKKRTLGIYEKRE